MTVNQINGVVGGVSAGKLATNAYEVYTLKKELKDLSNPTKAKKLYKDSTTMKPYNTWVNERKRYIQMQLKNLRFSSAGAAVGLGYSGYNLYKKTAGYHNLLVNPIEFNNGLLATGAMGAAGTAGTIYSVKKLAQCRKELKLLKNNPNEARKLYKQSNSKKPFQKWKLERINELKKLTKTMAISGAASLGLAGISGLTAYNTLKEELLPDKYLLNESFYGKPQVLKTMESELWGTLIKAVSNNENPYKYRSIITKNEKILEKLFNVERIKLHIGSNYSENNAFTFNWNQTIGNSERQKSDYDTIETSEGIKFKDSKNKNINVYIYPSLFTGSLTEEEIMGIFLHEIGHNFFVIPKYIAYEACGQFMENLLELLFAYLIGNISFKEFITEVKSLVLISLSVKLPISFLPTKYKELLIKTIAWLTNPGSYDIIGDKLGLNLTIFNKVLGNIRSVFGDVNQVLAILTSPIKLLIKIILLGLLKTIYKRGMSGGLLNMDYEAEKFADAFAAKYGYGKDLYTALQKIMPNPQNKLDFIGYLTKLYSMFQMYVGLYFIDCHPTAITRGRKIMALYRKELSNNKNKLNAKDKEMIKKQLNKMEDLLEKTKDKSLLEKIELKLDKPFSKIREFEANKTTGMDATFL